MVKKHTPESISILKEYYSYLETTTLSNKIHDALVQKFSLKIPSSGIKKNEDITYFELFKALSGYDHKNNRPHIVLLKGGTVRDIVQNGISENHDVDIVHTKPFNQARYGTNGLNTLNVYYKAHKDSSSNYYYIRVGSNSKNCVECTQAFFGNIFQYESPANSLFIDVTQYGVHASSNTVQPFIIDIFGIGLQQARNKVWDVPSKDLLSDHTGEWVRQSKLWRMIKFGLRGYTISLELKKYIYEFWLNTHMELATYNWAHIWYKLGLEVFPTTNTSEMMYNAVKTLFAYVEKDFQNIHFKSRHAADFCSMLIIHDVLPLRSRLKDLSKIRKHNKTVKFKKKKRLSKSVKLTAEDIKEVDNICKDIHIQSAKKKASIHTVFEYVEKLVQDDVLTTYPVLSIKDRSVLK